MSKTSDNYQYDFRELTAVVTGGAGVLCATMCKALASAGASVAILDLNEEAAQKFAAEVKSEGGKAAGFACNVLQKENFASVASKVVAEFGRVDILINGAGGNNTNATTSDVLPFFDLPEEALQMVIDLNLMGTILPSQVFGKIMAEQEEGVIVNISSMNAFRPLTRIPAYSSAKAGVSNFTKWLAVHMAQNYSSKIRVNAIAPGFFLTKQNRFLLIDEKTNELTDRGRLIIDHTPQGHFGKPEDLVGTLLWLVSPLSSFVTGIVVPVDGGFSAFSGV
jgi:NAD(P)-dependent dehydrogenase (short-subunit alcohol dehydrogenase family)